MRRLLGQVSAEEEVRFRCNICGRRTRVLASSLSRENVTCRCGSTVRLRALMHVLSMELYGESMILGDFPPKPEIVVLDMSGAVVYANRLVKKLDYTNTFLHKAPRMDITEPDPQWEGRCDFVISSDVFEHVVAPVSRAFENALGLLNPGGVLLVTVPYNKTGETVEHFPELHNYSIEMRNGQKVLVNVTAQGVRQEFEDLVFHGGEGETLEMRVFSESGVLTELRKAGFTDIRIWREPCQDLGIMWHQDWSLPISARRPPA